MTMTLIKSISYNVKFHKNSLTLLLISEQFFTLTIFIYTLLNTAPDRF